MAEETETETAPADDIRSAVLAAVAEQEPPEPEKVEAKTPAKDESDKTEGKTERVRGEDGKFAKAAKEEGETEAKPEKAEASETEKPEAEAKDGEEKKEEVAPEFQKTLSAWKPADQATFKALPPDAQSFVMRRYTEMNADYTKKLQGISRLKTEYEPIDTMLAPHREVMKAKGFTPASLVEAWANVERKLVSGEQGALEVITGLVNGYNVPRDRIAQALGLVAAQQQEGAQPQPQIHPELARKLAELDQLKQTVNGFTAQQQQAQERQRAAFIQDAESKAEKFRSATDSKGNLLHPHVDDVENDMLALATAAQQAKQPVPEIEELYERAVWANPSTRKMLRTAELQAEEQKRRDQEKAKSAAARNAASSVTGAPGAGQAPSNRGGNEKSLREQLEEAASEAAA